MWPLNEPRRSPFTAYHTFGWLSFAHENNKSPSLLYRICVIDRSCPWSIIGFWKMIWETVTQSYIGLLLIPTFKHTLEHYLLYQSAKKIHHFIKMYAWFPELWLWPCRCDTNTQINKREPRITQSNLRNRPEFYTSALELYVILVSSFPQICGLSFSYYCDWYFPMLGPWLVRMRRGCRL